MRVSDDSAETKTVRAEAVDWVQLLDSGRVTTADIHALRAWRARSPGHDASFVEARLLWTRFGAAAGQMRQDGELASLQGSSPRAPSPGRLTRRFALGGMGAAAASAAIVHAARTPPLGLWPSLAELDADYRTRTGEQRRLALVDEVTVHMNTQTSVALRPAWANADRVELVAGEAEFEAKPRVGRDLIVMASVGEVAAAQARFDVRCNGATVRVSCVAGNVEVRARSAIAKLGPSQQIQYDRDGLGAVETASVELVTAWQDGVLIFRKTPLSDVVAEINRYRAGQVILLNRRLANLPVSGRFRIEHIAEIFLRLDQAFGIASRSLPGGIMLLS